MVEKKIEKLIEEGMMGTLGRFADKAESFYNRNIEKPVGDLYQKARDTLVKHDVIEPKLRDFKDRYAIDKGNEIVLSPKSVAEEDVMKIPGYAGSVFAKHFNKDYTTDYQKYLHMNMDIMDKVGDLASNPNTKAASEQAQILSAMLGKPVKLAKETFTPEEYRRAFNSAVIHNKINADEFNKAMAPANEKIMGNLLNIEHMTPEEKLNMFKLMGGDNSAFHDLPEVI